jgi:glycosyltransferase involved in cell wall biosynthesis
VTAMSARIGFAVNAPGIQERRAHALAGALGDCVADVMIAPTPTEVLRRARHWDVAYVIDPGRVGFPAAVAAKLAGATVLVEMGDPQRALYEAQDRSAPEQRLGALLDGIVSVGADGVVVRGRELARILRLRTRWAYVPDGVDLRHFRRLDASALRDQLGIPSGALVCGVVGSISWSDRARFTYGLDLVEAIARDEAGSMHALVVGDGTGIEMLRRRAAELGVVGRLHLVGEVAHELVPEHLNAMDVCVSTQTPDDVGRSRTTAKLPEYLACDRWVLASRVGGAAELLPDSMLMASELVDWPAYVGEMAVRLGQLAARLPEVRQNARTRAIAEREFDYEMLARRVVAFAARCQVRGNGKLRVTSRT